MIQSVLARSAERNEVSTDVGRTDLYLDVKQDGWNIGLLEYWNNRHANP